MIGEYNKTPYLLRQSGDGQLTIYNTKEIDKLIGGTVAWNQLVRNGNFADTSGWNTNNGTKSVANNVLTLTTTSPNNAGIYQSVSTISGHKYLLSGNIKLTTSASTVNMRWVLSDGGAGTEQSAGSIPSGVKTNSSVIVSPTSNWSRLYLLSAYSGSGISVGDKIEFSDFMCTDLTALFGSAEIADYVYSLEQTTVGSGIAWLRNHGFIDGSYRAYDSGSLQSVKTSEHRTTGKNLLKFPYAEQTLTRNGITYTVNSDGSITMSGTATANSVFILASKNTGLVLPSGTYTISANGLPSGCNLLAQFVENGVNNYMSTLTAPTKTYTSQATLPDSNHDIYISVPNGTAITTPTTIYPMINGGSTATEYEPYESHSYPLDPNLELRGKFKLDANNNLYADGDVYESSGAVTRKYGIVDLGTLNWGYVSSQARFYAGLNAMKPVALSSVSNAIATKYVTVSWNTYQGGSVDKCFAGGNASGNVVYIGIKDSSYTDTQSFKAAMSGVYLVYELATPTTETAQPYASPQVVNPLGTEEYIDTRDVPVPVGHETFYPVDVGYGDTLISDLPAFGSTIGPNDYLVLDNGKETMKVSAIDLVTQIVNSMNS